MDSFDALNRYCLEHGLKYEVRLIYNERGEQQSKRRIPYYRVKIMEFRKARWHSKYDLDKAIKSAIFKHETSMNLEEEDFA